MLVSRTWKEYGFKPHMIKQFKISHDPDFVKNLWMLLDCIWTRRTMLWWSVLMRKDRFEHLIELYPQLLMKPGHVGTMTHDYKHHGTSTLFAALNGFTGEVIGQCMKKHRHQQLLSFLKPVESKTPSDLELHVIVDNYATHKHSK